MLMPCTIAAGCWRAGGGCGGLSLLCDVGAAQQQHGDVQLVLLW